MLIHHIGKQKAMGLILVSSNTQSLAQIMKTSQGRILVTINDHPEMRKVFDGFTTKFVDINYTVGGSGKGKNAKK